MDELFQFLPSEKSFISSLTPNDNLSQYLLTPNDNLAKYHRLQVIPL